MLLRLRYCFGTTTTTGAVTAVLTDRTGCNFLNLRFKKISLFLRGFFAILHKYTRKISAIYFSLIFLIIYVPDWQVIDMNRSMVLPKYCQLYIFNFPIFQNTRHSKKSKRSNFSIFFLISNHFSTICYMGFKSG